jgi:serpin B
MKTEGPGVWDTLPSGLRQSLNQSLSNSSSLPGERIKKTAACINLKEKNMKLFCLVLILIGAGVCFSGESDTQTLVDGNTAFALDLYQKIRVTKGNHFFSPYSISTALAMTYGGARGDTEKQMAHVLHFSLDQSNLHPTFSELQSHFQKIQEESEFRLNIANALWIEESYKLLSEFLELNRKYYEANLFNVDFKKDPEGSRLKINDWVEKKTEEKIKDLLGEGIIDTLTRLVLTNTIYFKAEWDRKFDANNTKERDFWITEETKTKVHMMTQKSYFGYCENKDLQVLEMSYEGGNLSMVVLLPRKRDGLSELEAQLNTRSLKEWTSNLRINHIEIFIPKFTTTRSFNLNKILVSLGMVDAFSDSADFSGMEPKKELKISDVVHKAFIDVDEEGTEAAAATAVVMLVKSALPPKDLPQFIADHPFLYLIRDKETGTILFMGRLTEPGN